MKQYYSLKSNKQNLYTCIFVDDVIVKTKDHNIIKQLVNEQISFKQASKITGVRVIFNTCKNFEKWESRKFNDLEQNSVLYTEKVTENEEML